MTMLIVGATSAIAQAYARRTIQGHRCVLVGRSEERLRTIAADLHARGAIETECVAIPTWTSEAIQRWVQDYPYPIDRALIAQGVLPETAQKEYEQHEIVWRVNTIEPSAWLLALFQRMSAQPTPGTIAVITSVAGDRGRAANAVYGASKAALSTLIEALRQRAAHMGAHHVRILDVRPGPVTTPMTMFMKQTPLFATPDRVAADMDRAMSAGKTGIIYTPWWWRWIMGIIKLLPEFVFHRVRF